MNLTTNAPETRENQNVGVDCPVCDGNGAHGSVAAGDPICATCKGTGKVSSAESRKLSCWCR